MRSKGSSGINHGAVPHLLVDDYSSNEKGPLHGSVEERNVEDQRAQWRASHVQPGSTNEPSSWTRCTHPEVSQCDAESLTPLHSPSQASGTELHVTEHVPTGAVYQPVDLALKTHCSVPVAGQPTQVTPAPTSNLRP